MYVFIRPLSLPRWDGQLYFALAVCQLLARWSSCTGIEFGRWLVWKETSSMV
jgi:hypothetical protein